ncbi:MAG TPA: hypothetical protein VIT92_09345 [Burkholderiaceae bacterium]
MNYSLISVIALAVVMFLASCGGGGNAALPGPVPAPPVAVTPPPLSAGKVHAVPATMTVVDYTQSSRIRTARTAVIRSAVELQALWLEHRGGAPVFNVDFATQMVLAVFAGEGPDMCHLADIVGTAQANGKLSVTYTDKAPYVAGEARACAAALVTPAIVVVVPRFDGAVEFVHTDGAIAQLVTALDFDRFSAVKLPRNVAFSTQAEWAALWAETKAGAAPAPALPAVDFTKQNVIGIFTGAGATPCRRPVIDRVYPLADRIVVEYLLTNFFSNTCPGIESHALLAVVPKADLPYEFRQLPGRSQVTVGPLP